MTRHSIVLFTSLTLAMMAGCNATPPAPEPAPTPAPAASQKAGPTVIEVSTAEQLVNAIGPDRTIRVAPGEYILSDVKDRHMTYVRWYPEHDGNSLTIRNVKGMTIEGVGSERVRILVEPRYTFVLALENCEDVELKNLTLGHTPEKGICTCGVVGGRNSKNLRIINCDLFGCGTEGLTLKNVHGLTMKDSIIRDCSYGIMHLESCSRFTFVNVRFTGNEQFHGFDIADCETVLFESCVVEKNKAAEPLFQIVSSSDIRFVGGAIRGNEVPKLKENDDDIAIEGATVEGNKVLKP